MHTDRLARQRSARRTAATPPQIADHCDRIGRCSELPALGHVFVANSNVVFLGFAVVDAEDFSVPASLTAIAAFLLGALAGGRLAAWHGGHRRRLLTATLVIETSLASFALAVALVTVASALSASTRVR